MARFVVRRTRVLHVFESTSDEVDAESPEQALEQVLEAGDDDWRAVELTVVSSTSDVRPAEEDGR
jgi:hypothetical protein